MNWPGGLMFAADVQSRDELVSVVSDVAPHVDAVKIGNIALYESGFTAIGDVKEASGGLPVLVDLKLMEIPSTASDIVSAAVAAGADGLMVCGLSGRGTMEACRSAAQGRTLVVFTQFTHDAHVITDDCADRLITAAAELEFEGVQVPGTRPERVAQVRRRVGKKLLVFCCGIGVQGPKYGSAIRAGADYEIVGRAIRLSPDPPREAQRARDAILNARSGAKG